MGILSGPVAGNISRVSTERSLVIPNGAPTTSPTLRSMVLWRGATEGLHYQQLVRYFWQGFWALFSLGLHKFYYERWSVRYSGEGKRRAPLDHQDSEQLVNAATVFLVRLQWMRTVKMMLAVWKSVWVGCALILPLSITLLQVDGVIDNTFARTSALAAIVFSSAGILSSSVFVSGKLDFSCKRMEQRWKEASKCHPPLNHVSTEFWACLALPVSSGIWAGIFTIATIVTIAWMERSDLSSGGCSSTTYGNCGFFASAISVTTLIFLSLAQICRAVMVLTR